MVKVSSQMENLLNLSFVFEVNFRILLFLFWETKIFAPVGICGRQLSILVIHKFLGVDFLYKLNISEAALSKQDALCKLVTIVAISQAP